MTDNEAEVLSNSESIEIVGEEERDREFFNSLPAPSITKETIINLSSDRLQEVRSQVSQLESVVTDLRSTIPDLRSAVTELRQPLGRATRSSYRWIFRDNRSASKTVTAVE